MSVPGRRFPDELLTPRKPGEAPEGARVDLVCHDRQLIRGSVAGADVPGAAVSDRPWQEAS
jgi:hypothetical protein